MPNDSPQFCRRRSHSSAVAGHRCATGRRSVARSAGAHHRRRARGVGRRVGARVRGPGSGTCPRAEYRGGADRRIRRRRQGQDADAGVGVRRPPAAQRRIRRAPDTLPAYRRARITLRVAGRESGVHSRHAVLRPGASTPTLATRSSTTPASSSASSLRSIASRSPTRNSPRRCSRSSRCGPRPRLERVRAEAALAASETSYRAIFESAEDAIFVHDWDTGAIVDVNPTACRVFGWSRDEMLKLDVEDFSSNVAAVHPRDRIALPRRSPARADGAVRMAPPQPRR